jgi:hypothetical protein
MWFKLPIGCGWIQSPKLGFYLFIYLFIYCNFVNFFCVSDTMVHPKFETLFIYLFIFMDGAGSCESACH